MRVSLRHTDCGSDVGFGMVCVYLSGFTQSKTAVLFYDLCMYVNERSVDKINKALDIKQYGNYNFL